MGNWDYKHKSVQQYDNPESSAQLSSRGVLISFGPPVFQESGGDGIQTVVCGFVQNFNMNQQKQIQQLFEVGSERRYWVDGPDRNQVQISRALFSGPSILKVAGMGLTNRGLQGNIEQDFYNNILEGEDFNTVGGADKSFWINLGSDFFKNPLGILIEFREIYGNGRSSSYGSMYLTNARVSGHGVRFSGQQRLMQENMQIMFEKAIPLDRGTSVKDQYSKRKEIMEATHNMTPEEFEDYANWQGESSDANTGTNVPNIQSG